MPLMQDLIALHRVDSQVRALQGRLDGAKRYLTAQQKQVDELETQRQDLHLQIRQVNASVGNLENDIRGINERVDKLRGELNSTTNTRQYNVVLQELKLIETNRKELETQAEALMEKGEQATTRVTALEAQLAERTKLRDQARGDLNQKTADVADRLSELQRERAAAAARVPEASRKVFDHVAALHDGEAMASVVTLSARHREYACGACNCEIPFESFSRLKSNPEALVQCLSCHRILHLEAVEEAHA